MEARNEIIALSTLQSLNTHKNFDNNTLFEKEREEEEMKEKITALKILARQGLRSDCLYKNEQKAKELYNNDKFKSFFSVSKKCMVDRHTFDSLRKVLQLACLEKKIDKWINSTVIPAFYPRNIDEIR